MGKHFVKQEAFDAAWWWCVYVAAPRAGSEGSSKEGECCVSTFAAPAWILILEVKGGRVFPVALAVA